MTDKLGENFLKKIDLVVFVMLWTVDKNICRQFLTHFLIFLKKSTLLFKPKNFFLKKEQNGFLKRLTGFCRLIAIKKHCV